MKKTPIATMKEKFGEKAKLVEAVKVFAGSDLWLPRLSSDRGKDRGIEHISNSKLLRLHAIFTEVKEKFGTREKLLEAILTEELRGKDAGYKKRLETYPMPRLYDHYKTLQKRSKAAKKA
jgi:hypothetical protein